MNMNIISNCPLCEARGLHSVEQDDMQQCLNCGYVTTEKFKGNKETNTEYKNLSEDMQLWVREANDRIWIPSMIVLPFGTLYPINIKKYMYWAIAEMVDIPEEEQENYPDENGSFYTKMYDTDNQKLYDTFLEAMTKMNEKAKENISTTDENNELPKLKKISG